MLQYPILYSLQHCPYAIRARLAILLSKQKVYLRAIRLDNKPAEMMRVSPSGTVPLLIVNETLILDESLEIMLWLLAESDPEDLLLSARSNGVPTMIKTIYQYDQEFKVHLEQYKSAKRYHESDKTIFRLKCEEFIAEFEQRLAGNQFYMGEKLSLVDYAILPYIRQFSRVERPWFRDSPYPNVRLWLNNHLKSPLFSKAMTQYSLWLESQESHLMQR